MERCIAGKLTDEEARCFDSALNPTDIIFNHQEGHYQENKLVVSDGFMGVRCRGSGTMAVNELHISRIKNDALNLWKGGVNIQRLYVDHSLPVKYTKHNHPDCVHVYAKRLANDPDTSPPVLRGLYIGYAKFIVKCHGPEDKKNFVIFSEARNKEGQELINKNIYLFENGVDVELDGDSAGPYLIDSTNFTDSVFGSEGNPIDPERIAGRGIRIGGNKPDLPASSNIVIHAVKGLNIVLNDEVKDSVDIRWQERKTEQPNEGETMLENVKVMVSDKQKITPFIIAQGQQGQKEIKGSEDNPAIVEYFKATSYHASDDETPWCSAAHCWVHQQAGKAHTKSAAALSWKDWGVALKKPVHGCTIVGDRGKGRGHVGFYVGETDDAYIILGGNQSDAYNTSHYPKRNMVNWYFRKPKTDFNSKTNWSAGTLGAGGTLISGFSANEMIPADEPVKKPDVVLNQESPIKCSTELCPVDIPANMTLIPTSLYEAGLAGGVTMLAIAGFIIYERLKKISNHGI